MKCNISNCKGTCSVCKILSSNVNQWYFDLYSHNLLKCLHFNIR